LSTELLIASHLRLANESLKAAQSLLHQLDTMVRGLPAVNAFMSDLSDLTWLEAYATAFRYPRTKGGINDPPRAEQLEEALTKTASLLKKVADHFGVVDLSASAKSPAAHSKPPRKN
jgi:hypothetical protein